jgi:S-adenosylmethionine synthetase
MSMNIMITAERKITFKNKAGKQCTGTQIEFFNALQTPTEVTFKILHSADQVKTYIDWVLAECSQDEISPVYAEADIFQEREPVGTEVWNHGKEHVEDFKKWMTEVEEQGFTVKFEVT